MIQSQPNINTKRKKPYLPLNIAPEGSTQQSAMQAQEINRKSFKKRTIQPDGIADYNIDYAKVKEKSTKQLRWTLINTFG